MIDISSWHATADNPPDRVPLLCYCDADGSMFLGFAIHPYLSLDRTVSLVNWFARMAACRTHCNKMEGSDVNVD